MDIEDLRLQSAWTPWLDGMPVTSQEEFKPGKMLEILSSVTSFIRVKRFQYAEEYTTKDFNTQKSTQQK